MLQPKPIAKVEVEATSTSHILHIATNLSVATRVQNELQSQSSVAAVTRQAADQSNMARWMVVLHDDYDQVEVGTYLKEHLIQVVKKALDPSQLVKDYYDK